PAKNNTTSETVIQAAHRAVSLGSITMVSTSPAKRERTRAPIIFQCPSVTRNSFLRRNGSSADDRLSAPIQEVGAENSHPRRGCHRLPRRRSPAPSQRQPRLRERSCRLHQPCV